MNTCLEIVFKQLCFKPIMNLYLFKVEWNENLNYKVNCKIL